MRHLASSGVDVYTAVAGAVGALYGPLHGGANEAVLRMLERIGSVDNIPAFVEGVKNRKEKMFGFGHRCGQPCRIYEDIVQLGDVSGRKCAGHPYFRTSTCLAANASFKQWPLWILWLHRHSLGWCHQPWSALHSTAATPIIPLN